MHRAPGWTSSGDRSTGLEEEIDDDTAYAGAEEEVLTTAARLFREPTPRGAELLDRLQRWAEQASVRPDAKAATLIRWLNDTCGRAGSWTDTRVIIFTEYRDTQNWLHELLADAGSRRGDRLLTLYGGMDTEERERVKAAFQAHPDQSAVRILLATDAASEGIDLQNHCSRLIHYEIPWNPNRLEQRNGRVDRHGQRADAVLIYHFVGRGYREQAETANVAGRPRGRPRVPDAGGAQGRADPRGPRQGRPGDRRAGRGGDARPASTLDTREAERQAEPARAHASLRARSEGRDRQAA